MGTLPKQGQVDMEPPKPKQTGQPKRSQSAYFIYMNEQRADFKKENPKLSMTEMTKELAKEWKDLSEEEKRPYLDDAAEQKEKYKIKREEYEAGSAYKKYKRDLKRWKERYAEEWAEQEEDKKIYKEEQKENPKLSMTEMTKELAKEWK